MGVFVGHEPCPKCGSKDNLARYQDGGAFCFGCRYYEPPTHFAPYGQEKEDPIPVILPKDLTSELPKDNFDWLAQYLTPEEIKANFSYSPALQRHVYAWTSEFNGDCYWEARSVLRTPDGMFSHKTPKTVSRGNKPFFILGNWRGGGKVVLVEDIVSAIKLARITGSIPLFGAILRQEYLMRLVKIPSIKEIVVWLDRDKYKEALKLADRISFLRRCTVLSTEDDPKALSEAELKELLT
jgi:twinkle protein